MTAVPSHVLLYPPSEAVEIPIGGVLKDTFEQVHETKSCLIDFYSGRGKFTLEFSSSQLYVNNGANMVVGVFNRYEKSHSKRTQSFPVCYSQSVGPDSVTYLTMPLFGEWDLLQKGREVPDRHTSVQHQTHLYNARNFIPSQKVVLAHHVMSIGTGMLDLLQDHDVMVTAARSLAGRISSEYLRIAEAHKN